MESDKISFSETVLDSHIDDSDFVDFSLLIYSFFNGDFSFSRGFRTAHSVGKLSRT